MRALAGSLTGIVWLSTIDPAAAHPALQGVSGFYGGLLHPLLVPSHLIAAVGLGLLIGQQAPHEARAAPVAYIAAVIAGLAAIALAYVPTFAEETLLGCAAISGLLAALARPLPQVTVVPLAAATGLSLALDSPPDAISLAAANRALLGTAVGAGILLVSVSEGASRLRRTWQRIGLRIAGSWIAASAILVLALRFAR
jgi:urease accessory protein